MDVFDLKGVLSLDTSKFESGLKGAGNMATNFGSGLVNGFKKVAGLTTAALGAVSAVSGKFLKDAVNTGMAFDSMMGQVGATMGKDVEAMEQELGSVDVAFGDTVKHFEGSLRDFALFMGQNTKFSATEAAQALNYMALAGYNTEQSMQMLPAVLNMAAAGAMDLGRASDIVTDVQSALGVSFERTNQMVDEFAKAASSGNTTVEMLGEAFLKVGGLAKELNGGIVIGADGIEHEVDGIQELEIAFTAMANAGIKGNEAGTHMRNMLLKLSSPTDKGAQAFENLGVNVFDAEGRMRSLADIFSDLNAGLSKVSQADKLQAIGNIFNARDTASAEALLGAIEGTVKYEGEVYAISTAYEKWGDAIYDVNQGFEVTAASWDYLGTQILDAEGAAAAMSSRQLNNLKGSITLFKSALETAKITVSDKLTPSLREFIDFGTEGLQKLVDGFNEGGLTGAMDVFGEILSDGLVKIINKLPDFTEVAGNILKALGKGLMDNIDAVSDAATSILTMIAELTLKGFPALLTIIGDIFKKIGTWVVDNADLILDGIEGVLDTIINFVTDNTDSFLEGAGQLIEKIVLRLPELIKKITKAIPKNIRSISKAIVDNAPILIKGATDCIVEIVKAMPDILMALVEEAPNILMTLVKSLTDNIPTLVTGLAETISVLITHIPEIIKGIIDYIPDMIDMLFDRENGFLSQDNVGKFITGFGKLVVKLVLAIPQIISYLLTDGIPSIIKSILNAFGIDMNDPNSLGYKLYHKFKDFMDGVAPVFGILGIAAEEAFSIIVQAFSDPKGALKRVLEDMVTLVRKAVEETLNAFETYQNAYIKWIENQQNQAITEENKKRLDNAFKLLEEQGYVIVEDEEGIRRALKPGAKDYEDYMKNHKGTSGGTYFGEGEAPKETTGSSTSTWRRGSTTRPTTEPGVINVDWWGRTIEDKEPQKVEVEFGGEATVKVEGANDEQTFKKVNKYVTDKAKTDLRVLDYGG